MAQVRSNAHPLGAGVVGLDGKIVSAYIEIEGTRWAPGAFCEGEPLDRFGRQHGDLAARHVHGREPLARHGVERRSGCEPEGGGGNVNADAKAAVSKRGERERIVDFRRSRVVDAECFHFSDRQSPRLGYLELQRKIRPLWKVFVEKPVEMVIVAGWQRSAAL